MPAASKSRVAPFTACLECRRLKRRCTGGKPCERCASLAIECVMDPSEAKSFIARLERRVMELQSQIDRLSAEPPSTPSQLSYPAQTTSTVLPVLQHPFFSHSERPSRKPSSWLPFFPYPIWSTIVVDTHHYEPGEPYHSVVARQAIETAMAQLDLSEPFPLEICEYLHQLVHPVRHQYNQYLDPRQYIERLRTSTPNDMHVPPASVHILNLIGCSAAGGALSRYEPIILVRLRKELNEALASADHSTFIRSSCVLAQYFRRAGRIHEAYHTISGAVDLAVGLHYHLGLVKGPPAVTRPAPTIPEQRAIYREDAWLKLWLVERALCREHGFPNVVPKECIPSIDAVPLPKSIMDPDGKGEFAPLPAVRVHFWDLHSFDLTDHDDMWIKVKIAVLIDATVSFVRCIVDHGVDTKNANTVFYLLQNSLLELERTLPHFTDKQSFLPEEELADIGPIINSHLALKSIKIMLLSLIVGDGVPCPGGVRSPILSLPFLDWNEAYRMRLEAATEMALLSHLVCQADPNATFYGELDCWSYAQIGCHVFLHEIRHQHAEPPTDATNARLDCARQNLKYLLDYLAGISSMYPAWRVVPTPESAREMQDIFVPVTS